MWPEGLLLGVSDGTLVGVSIFETDAFSLCASDATPTSLTEMFSSLRQERSESCDTKLGTCNRVR